MSGNCSYIPMCNHCFQMLLMQDAFDGVEKELREALTLEQQTELEDMCLRTSVERLELLLLQLFEYIMLRLSEPRQQDDDTRAENYK